MRGKREEKLEENLSLTLSLSLQAPSWVRQWHQQVQPLLGPVSLSWTVPTLTLLCQWQPPSCLNLAITSAGEVSMSNTSTKIIQRWTRQDFVTDILAIPSSTDLLRVTTVYTLGRFWTGKAKMIFGNWWVENTAESFDKGNQQTDKLTWCSRLRQQTVLARLLCTWPPTTAVGTCSTCCSTAGQTRHTGTRSGRHVTRDTWHVRDTFVFSWAGGPHTMHTAGHNRLTSRFLWASSRDLLLSTAPHSPSGE